MRKTFAVLLAAIQLVFAVWLALHTAAEDADERRRAAEFEQNAAVYELRPSSVSIKKRDDGYTVSFSFTNGSESETDGTEGTDGRLPLLPTETERVYRIGAPEEAADAAETLDPALLREALRARHLLTAQTGEDLTQNSGVRPRLLIKEAWTVRAKAIGSTTVRALVYGGDIRFTALTVKGKVYAFAP